MDPTVGVRISTALRVSVVCWLIAIAAGVFETVLVASGVGDDTVTGAALWAGVGLRVGVFAVALVFVARLVRGSGFARWSLTVLLGVLGLASIIGPAIASMADGNSLLGAFSDDGDLPVVFALSRVAHAVAVVVATVSMWLPSARRR